LVWRCRVAHEEPDFRSEWIAVMQEHSPEAQQRAESRPTDLRYRIADFLNDCLKIVPGLHSVIETALPSFASPRTGANQPETEVSCHTTAAESPQAHVNTSHEADVSELAVPTISPDNLPIPPLEMRQLVGPTDVAAFENPSGGLVYPYLSPEFYESVFDFGCGCGRVARQLIQQHPRPKRYVGVDLHAGMIRWCQRNLQPAGPEFSFFHHDVYNARFNPNPASPAVAPFPAGDGEFTLVNALSVFTHLTQEQAVHYLAECARILHPEGVLHASWFLFQKRKFPMMRPETNALYVSYADPSAAVLFDRDWVRATARQFGLRISQIVTPYVRGHQWALIMTKRQDVAEPEFPADTAPYGEAYPPTSERADLASIGLDAE
jgi:SAM-dependent methyltransferase